jgi:hypothetical protein
MADPRDSDYRVNVEQPETLNADCPQLSGSALLRRLQNHRAAMSPEQKKRRAGMLLLDATAEIDRLIGLCIHVHDRMLRGDDDTTLLRKLQEGWQGPL